MGIDLKAMREKLANLTTKGTNSNLLKLAEGDTQVRILPLKNSPDNPFVELLFHYIGNKTYLSPRSYGETDPIADFSDQIVAEGGLTKEEYVAIKKLSPQLRTFALVTVRGKESEGAKWWGFGKQTYATLLKTIDDPDYGDITDITSGHDITLTYTPAEKSDTKFAKTDIVVRPKPRALAEDADVVQKLLNEQPDIMDVYTKYTADELSDVLQKYLNPSSNSSPVAAKPATETASTTEWGNDEKTSDTAPKKVSADIAQEFSDIFNN